MGTLSSRKLAIITGASSGIGYELARQCAAHDFDLVVCAEDQGIQSASVALAADAQVMVTPVQADLSRADGCDQLAKVVKELGRPVDALLLNAGVGVGGPFVETMLEQELAMIGLNCGHTVHLAKLFVPDMVARGQGRVLITASVVSTAPAPFEAVYGATKAFVLSFAMALREELKDSGVTVTAIQPGATETQFFERAHLADSVVGKSEKDDPADVAARGFDAMMAGRSSALVGGLKAKLQGALNEVLPETVKAKAAAKGPKPAPGGKA